jgi:hypothetical protein
MAGARRSTIETARAGVLAAAIVASLAPLLTAGESLGDAARREQERRKKSQEQSTPAPVIGLDDLASAKGETLAQEPSKTAKTARRDAARADGDRLPSVDDEEEGQASASDEEAWRARLKNAQARLDVAQKNYDNIHKIWVGYGSVLVDKDGNAVAWNQQQVELMRESARAALDTAKAALDRIFEDARRAGVPPGWLR